MKSLYRVGLLLVLVTIVGSAQAADVKIQKWVDGAGNVHFGDKPPNNARAEEMVIRTFEPASAAAAGAAATEKEKKLPAEESEGCKDARKQLADYERAPFLYETDADGKRHILPDEQRKELLEGVKERVKAECG